MYSPTLTDPIRQELQVAGIQELKDRSAVEAFMKEQKPSTVMFINSVCGCAAGTARPGLYSSLKHPLRPQGIASVFAGVDTEAATAIRGYLPGLPPSSPSIAFFREGELVHFIGRHSIEGVDETLLTQSIEMVYSKYFDKTIREDIILKEPAALLERDTATVRSLLAEEKSIVLDCRDEGDFQNGALPGARLLSNPLAEEMLQSWDREQDLTIYCTDGTVSTRAALYFRQQGFKNVFILAGGYSNKSPSPIPNGGEPTESPMKAQAQSQAQAQAQSQMGEPTSPELKK